jgi:hypothetical protein
VSCQVVQRIEALTNRVWDLVQLVLLELPIYPDQKGVLVEEARERIPEDPLQAFRIRIFL